MPGDDGVGKHPLEDRLRLVEWHIQEVFERLDDLARHQAKVEGELLALAGQIASTTETMRRLLVNRDERDREREEDRAIVRQFIFAAIAIGVGVILAFTLLAQFGVLTGPMTLRGLVPPPHSSQLPREAGGSVDR